MLRRVPLHPLLVAAFPVLLLWAQNGSEVPPGDGVRTLLVVLGIVAVAAAATSMLFAGVQRGALVASVLAAVALAHGHLWGADGGVVPGLPVAVVVLFIASRRVRALDEDDLGRTTLVANLVALGLVAATLPGVVGSVRAATAAPLPPTPAAGPATGQAGGPAGLRDVVWIVPDRHGSQAGLAHTFDLDTSDFTAALEAGGFSVADHARSNYPKTSHALAATLHLDDLDELAARIPAEGDGSLAAVNAMLGDHEVGRRMQAAGYDYVHLGSWWGPTADPPGADTVLTLPSVTTSEFADVLLGTTVLHALGVGIDAPSDPSQRDRHRAHAQWQLDQLDGLAQQLVDDTEDAPRFVFVHLLLPHEPYVFDRDGSLVDRETEAGRTRAENFERQLTYLHARLLPVLDTLATAPDEREPVVLLQADEGPHPATKELVNDDFPWSTATDDELVTKFSILSALRVPGRDVELPEDVTAINVARLLVNEVLGTTLEPLPDRSWIYPDEDHYYDFTDVTARLDAAG